MLYLKMQETFPELIVKKEIRGFSISGLESGPVRTRDNSNKHLQAIIDSLDDELMVIDQNYRIIVANNAVLSKHQKTRQDVIGQRCYAISHNLPEPCQDPYDECPIKTVCETGKPARVVHVHVYQAWGKKRESYVDVIASPIKDSHGNIIAVAELMRDITKAKEMESAITKAHRDLLVLNAISGLVSQSLDLDTILNNALEKILEIMAVDAGGILLLDEEMQILRYRAHRGLSDEYVNETCLTLEQGIAGKVAETGEAILIEDILTDPRAACLNLIIRDDLRAFGSIPIRSKGKVLGVLNIASDKPRKFSSEEIQLLSGIAGQVALAMQNAELYNKLQRKDEIHSELLRETLSIQEEERKRIARELHDETSQALATLIVNLESLVGILPVGADKAKDRLRAAQALVVNTLGEIDKLIYRLRPSLLDDLGLVAATRWLVNDILGVAGVAVDFKTVGRKRRLPPGIETTLFRIIQEGVSNIARHADAKKANISLHFRRGSVRVNIRDDGKGFAVAETMSPKSGIRRLGLLGMRERIELVQGSLNIRSRSNGGGTEIEVEIPLNHQDS